MNSQGHKALARTLLPFNRKERYFTGTVLPSVVCADNLRHLHHFFRLLTTRPLPVVEPDPAKTNLQFFTEYNFVEALVSAPPGRFPEAPTSRDTPDLVCLLGGGPNVLIAVEAKMYDRPSRADLLAQFEAQERILSYLGEHLPATVVHTMLLPEQLARRVALPDSVTVVTWERLADTFRPLLGPSHYFLAALDYALEHYESLMSKSGGSAGQNADGWLAGEEILARINRRDPQVLQIGRIRGASGPEFLEDIRSGRWRTLQYEVSGAATPANRNWFSAEEFVAGVTGSAKPTFAEWSASQSSSGARRSEGARPHHRRLRGDEIVRLRSDPTIRCVGRNRGLHGPEFRGDVASGAWRSQVYEVCSASPPPNHNWFTIREFLDAVRA